MASKSKTRPPRKKPSNQPNQLANLGLFEIPNFDDIDINEDVSDVDDNDLESELAALMRGEAPVRRNKQKAAAPPVDIERLAADCLKDDIDDDHEEDDDEDLTTNEELLRELQGLSPNAELEKDEPVDLLTGDVPSDEPPAQEGSILNVLQSRLELYKEAETTARINNDTSKVRRYGRALKTLESQVKAAKSGAAIDEADIPPVVNIPKKAAAPIVPPTQPVQTVPEDVPCPVQNVPEDVPPAIPQRTSSVTDTAANVSPALSLLISRQSEYKTAALQAKRSGNKELAIQHMRTAKTFDPMILAARKNEPFDISNIPPPPMTETNTPKVEQDQHQTASALEIAALKAANEDEAQLEIFNAPPAPTTVLEALQQRLQKFTDTKTAAENENNSGKVRRLQRIIKSYEEAIRNYKAGKPVDFEELPTPPGFGPIPVEVKPSETKVVEPKPSEPKPSPQPAARPTASNPAPAKKQKLQRGNTSTAEKQLEFLMERQKLFREAALSAKKEGNIQQAKEYLKMSKGFDSMIEATKCGLPIDASSIPTPPQLESDFVVVSLGDCSENSDLNQEDLLDSLESDLLNQLEICTKNKNYFLRLGDVQSASKFEKLGLESRKDLSSIQFLKKQGEAVPPKFHYETRLFSMVMCNADLADNVMEVIIRRGINLPGKPDDLDSYVRVELPIPTETPQRAKTHTIRDTNNPVFEETFKFEINRKSRAQLRLFKRNNLKCEVWSKGGFLRSDTLLGSALVKLVMLESKCSVHDSFDLMDGRKLVGGKLEVEMRIRDPLLTKQVEEVQEKWLVIGS